MSTRDRVLQYLKEAHSICTPRYTAVKLHLSESTVRRVAEVLVKEGLVRRSMMWKDRGWHYRRAGYVAVYRYVGS